MDSRAQRRNIGARDTNTRFDERPIVLNCARANVESACAMRLTPLEVDGKGAACTGWFVAQHLAGP